MTERRRNRVLSALVLAAALTACSSSPSATDVSTVPSGPASQPVVRQPSIVFMSYAGSVTVPHGFGGSTTDARVAGVDGRQWRPLLPVSTQSSRLWVSADGSVVAYRVPIGKATMDEESPANVWVIGPHGTQRIPVAPALLGVAAVAADGHAVYVTHGLDVVRYDVGTGAVSTMCARCVKYSQHALSVAVSADESRIAVSGSAGGDWPLISVITIIDARRGDELWTKTYDTYVHAENFIDDTSLVTTVDPPGAEVQAPPPGALRVVTGIGSGHVVDRPTGISAYGPVDHVGGTWWYYRDSWNWVTSVFTNTDLTPAHETKIADRVDGKTSFDYHPVTADPNIPPSALMTPGGTSPTPPPSG